MRRIKAEPGFSSRLDAALGTAIAALLAERNSAGVWEGELSSSALSTATAVAALSVFQRAQGDRSVGIRGLVEAGLDWLGRQVNPDGGWGDTPLSSSNLSTTTLCWAAYGITGGGAESRHRPVVQRAETWIVSRTGGLDPPCLGRAILDRYGADRTFSVPILTTCALSGRWGEGAEAWDPVIPLPFELSVLPRRLFGVLGLPVVSYALPALIALGYARFRHSPPAPPLRGIRSRCVAKSLDLLTAIQPSSGGFLEAVPLTSFVAMSLAGSDQDSHPVALLAIEFLKRAVRPDGSWPIDTNLATWLTTLAVNALATAEPTSPTAADYSPVADGVGRATKKPAQSIFCIPYARQRKQR